MLVDKIADLIRDALKHKGYDLAKVHVVSGQKMAIEIFIDRFDEEPISINDCVAASRTISAILDVEDIIREKYNLNISSPGEYRPISTIADFERFCGRSIKLELLAPVENKKKFEGVLVKIEQNINDVVVYLREECNTVEATIGFVFDNIKKASVKRNFLRDNKKT